MSDSPSVARGSTLRGVSLHMSNARQLVSEISSSGLGISGQRLSDVRQHIGYVRPCTDDVRHNSAYEKQRLQTKE